MTRRVLQKTVLLKITETKFKQINSACRYVLTQGVTTTLNQTQQNNNTEHSQQQIL